MKATEAPRSLPTAVIFWVPALSPALSDLDAGHLCSEGQPLGSSPGVCKIVGETYLSEKHPPYWVVFGIIQIDTVLPR